MVAARNHCCDQQEHYHFLFPFLDRLLGRGFDGGDRLGIYRGAGDGRGDRRAEVAACQRADRRPANDLADGPSRGASMVCVDSMRLLTATNPLFTIIVCRLMVGAG